MPANVLKEIKEKNLIERSAEKLEFPESSTAIKKKVKKLSKELFTKGFSDLLSEDDFWIENGYLTASSFSLKGSWKGEKRNWGHSMHSMASRSGSFPPALTNYFIENFSKKNQTVLDPFSGKGTTLFQALLSERNAVSIDITPEAYIMSAAKASGIDHETAVEYLRSIKLKKDIELIKGVPEEVKIFYHDKTLAQIVSLQEELMKDYSFKVAYLSEKAPCKEFSNKKNIIPKLKGTFGIERADLKNKDLRAKCSIYWMGVMMGILHGSSDLSLSVPCSHSFSMSPGYVKNYTKKHGLIKPDRDVKACLIKRSEKLQFDGAPKRGGKVILGSAMDMPHSLTNQIDLIITSPPYYTAQTYAWDNWLREWFLGFNFKEVRTKTLHTNVEDKYRAGMHDYLRDSYRVMKPGTWSFVVVGDVMKKINGGKDKKHLITSNVIAEEAMKVGFSVELVINDDIPPENCYNRAFLKEGQGLKLDRIVCLYKN